MYHQQALIERFYKAFAARDLEGMLAVYHPDIVFSDPVFGQLKGREVGAMWAMLLQASESRQLDITHHDVRVQNSLGLARWEARYQLAATGGRIHNRISARFGFRDGLIAEHHDSFDLAHWSAMAVPVWGSLLGGQPWFQSLFQGQARRQLQAFQARKP
ncbi:MAG: nuclear transport factor 2 family protein [Candidatus Sericytochromatia bacterium]|nr:nuclear transport factor 2 family protein [Candidatus Sericytochromatia bacterium]